MNDLNEPQTGIKKYFVIASLLFGLFFGAGNLIFPIHLGQMAGSHWLVATLGFLTASVLMPLLAILVISKSNASGIGDLGNPAGTKFALLFMILVQVTIGPLYATPRVATVSFAVGIKPLLGGQHSQLALLIYSALFFAVAFYFANRESTIIDTVGKIMNPLFLILLATLFVLAMLNPMGNPNLEAGQANFGNGTYFKGFLEGYNTLDMLAGLVFGGAVINSVREMGYRKKRDVERITSLSGILTFLLTGLIYVGLILLGAMSLGKEQIAAEGGTTLVQIVRHLMGEPGQLFLAALIILACLTTAIGLLTSFADDFHRSFSKLSYRAWLTISTVASFGVANIGLEKLIHWSVPILMFLYPIVIVLVLLGLTVYDAPAAKQLYRGTLLLTIVPALLDFVVKLPKQISGSAFGQAIANIQSHLPFYDIGLTWIIPSIIGFLISWIYYMLRYRKIGLTK